MTAKIYEAYRSGISGAAHLMYHSDEMDCDLPAQEGEYVSLADYKALMGIFNRVAFYVQEAQHAPYDSDELPWALQELEELCNLARRGIKDVSR